VQALLLLPRALAARRWSRLAPAVPAHPARHQGPLAHLYSIPTNGTKPIC